MSPGLLYISAVIMMVAGIGFIYLMLRGRRPFRPHDALEWFGTVLSSTLILLAVVLIVLTSSYRPAPAAVPVAQASQNVPTIDPSELDRPARDFEFRLVNDDRPLLLSALKGKVVLLNLWATWCAPCRMEIPDLNRLQTAYADRGLVVLSVSDEPRADIVAFTQSTPMTTMSGYLQDPTLLPAPFLASLQVRPTTFVIDRGGQLRTYVVGAGTFTSFEQIVQPYL